MSTARKIWWLRSRSRLATARRVVYCGQVSRYGFADGSVLQITAGKKWQVIKC